MIVILMIISLITFPMGVSANAPEPAAHLTIVFSNLPDEAVYADLLIKIDENDPNYIDHRSNTPVDGIQNIEGLACHSENGYRSFTLHYKNAVSNIKIEHYYDDLYRVDFCNGPEYQAYLTQYEDLRENYNDIKIALLDKDFNIIVVSEATRIPKENRAILFSRMIDYDVSNDSFHVDTMISPYFILFSISIMLVSIGTELIIALLFGFKGKRLSSILTVNVCSQIIMRVLYVVLPLTYLIETVILEVLVYGTEFLIYRKRFEQISTTKIAIYTVIANTASLSLGILIDQYILV